MTSSTALRISMTAALVLALAGCSSPSDEPASSLAATTEEDGPTLNEHGNIAKDVGEVGSISLPDGSDAISFKVTNIERNPVCNSATGFGMDPKNGQYVALTIEMTTAPNYQDVTAGNAPLRLYWQDWTPYLSDGSAGENTPAGLTCFQDPEAWPLEVAPGTTTTAKYVVDVSPEATSLAWTSAFFSGSSGWEWQLPQ